jgi:hypothetical protein
MQHSIQRTFNSERLRDVLFTQFKIRIVRQVGDIAAPTGTKIVDRQNLPAIGQKTVTQMRRHKPCTA